MTTTTTQPDSVRETSRKRKKVQPYSPPIEPQRKRYTRKYYNPSVCPPERHSDQVLYNPVHEVPTNVLQAFLEWLGSDNNESDGPGTATLFKTKCTAKQLFRELTRDNEWVDCHFFRVGSVINLRRNYGFLSLFP